MTGPRGYRRRRLALRAAVALSGLMVAGCVLGALATMLLEVAGLVRLAVLVWTIVAA